MNKAQVAVALRTFAKGFDELAQAFLVEGMTIPGVAQPPRVENLKSEEPKPEKPAKAKAEKPAPALVEKKAEDLLPVIKAKAQEVMKAKGADKIRELLAHFAIPKVGEAPADKQADILAWLDKELAPEASVDLLG